MTQAQSFLHDFIYTGALASLHFWSREYMDAYTHIPIAIEYHTSGVHCKVQSSRVLEAGCSGYRK